MNFKTMKEILEKVLTDKAARDLEAVEAVALEQAEFLAWTG
jgi:hypothetical protein